MPFKHLTLNEILDYFQAINCLEDVHHISAYIYENRTYYQPHEIRHFSKILKVYSNLFAT